MSDKTVIWAIDSSERRYVRVEDYEKIKAERDALLVERDAAVKALKNALNAIEQHRLHHERGCAYLDGIPETIQAAIDAARSEK